MLQSAAGCSNSSERYFIWHTMTKSLWDFDSQKRDGLVAAALEAQIGSMELALREASPGLRRQQGQQPLASKNQFISFIN